MAGSEQVLVMDRAIWVSQGDNEGMAVVLLRPWGMSVSLPMFWLC